MQRAPYPTVPPDFGHWLAGFIDGEGCFFIQTWRNGAGYTPVFSLTVRDDDELVLRRAQERTGLGVVQQALPSRTPRSNPTIIWRIFRKSDDRRLCDILDAYPLRSKKAADYAIWRDAVLLWHAYRGSRWRGDAPPWPRMAELKRALAEGRRYDADLLGRSQRSPTSARVLA